MKINFFTLVKFTLISIISTTCSSLAQAQDDISVQIFQVSHSSGNEVDGVKVGIWKYYSENDSVCHEGSYNSEGKLQGTWSYYYLGGSKMKDIAYSEDEVVGWIRYIRGIKLIEIIPESSLKSEIYTTLEKHHVAIFGQEDINIYKKSVIKKDRKVTAYKIDVHPDYTKTFNSIQNSLVQNSYSGKCNFYYEDGRPRRQCSYVNGVEEKKYFIYEDSNDHRLIGEKYFSEGLLIKEIKYNKAGEVKKTIEY